MKMLLILSLFGCQSIPILADDIPLEVKRLQTLRDKKIEEINNVYRRELEALKISYTKAGDLESANLCVKLISSLESELPKDGDQLRVFLRGSVWRFDGDKDITLGEDGIVSKSWGISRPAWVVNGMKVHFEGKTFEFSKDFKKIYEVDKKEFPSPGKRLKP